MRQKIFEILNKLTLDNYDELKSDLVNYLKDSEQSKYMAEFIVDKAINEKMYTHLFTNLIKYLTDQQDKIKKIDKQISFKEYAIQRIDHLNDIAYSSLKSVKAKQLSYTNVSEELMFEEINFKTQAIF